MLLPQGIKHSVQITKTSRIKLYREIPAVTCENVKKHLNAVCDEKSEASYVKARDVGLCSGYCRALEASENYTLFSSSIFRSLICKMCIRNLQNALNSTEVWLFLL